MTPQTAARVRTPVSLAVAALTLSAGAAGASCAADRIDVMLPGGAAAFAVEIADEPAEQATGLMFRPALARDAGMLFVFDPPRPASFWMRNTMIPLDMLFIDDGGRVESIAERTDTYSRRVSESLGPVRAVLEINGGLSRELGIVPGTQLRHPAFRSAVGEARCSE